MERDPGGDRIRTRVVGLVPRLGARGIEHRPAGAPKPAKEPAQPEPQPEPAEPQSAAPSRRRAAKKPGGEGQAAKKPARTVRRSKSDAELWWRLPVLLDAYSGLRAGELWALRRRDVDPLRGEISVDEAIKEVTTKAAESVPANQRLTPSLIVGPTKTYAKRKVSVPAFLREALAAHVARPLPGGNSPDSFIFTTPTGEPVRHNLFYKREFAPVVASAIPAHPLRFTISVTRAQRGLIAAGAHPLQIKLRLGYQEIRTTMDTYGHLFPSTEPELTDLLDAGYRRVDDDGAGAVARR